MILVFNQMGNMAIKYTICEISMIKLQFFCFFLHKFV